MNNQFNSNNDSNQSFNLENLFNSDNDLNKIIESSLSGEKYIKHILDNDNLDNKFNQNTCSICLNEFKSVNNDNNDNNQICKISCEHCFHKNCIVNWLNNKKNCPLCKNECFKYDNEKKEFIKNEDHIILSNITGTRIIANYNYINYINYQRLLAGETIQIIPLNCYESNNNRENLDMNRFTDGYISHTKSLNDINIDMNVMRGLTGGEVFLSRPLYGNESNNNNLELNNS